MGNLSKMTVLIPVALIFAACKTTQKVATVDSVKKKIEVQSSSDERTAMPDHRKSSDINRSKEQLTVETKKNPRDIESLLNLAQIHLLQGEFDQAEKVCRQALKVDLKRVEARKILAQIYLRRGNTDMAGIILNGIGGENSRDSQVLNGMALIAFKEARFSDSVALFNEALRVNPNDVAVRMNLGVLYLQYRQMANAAVQFERVLKVMPSHPDAQLHLAVIEGTRGRFEVAEKIYSSILGNDKNNPIALYNLAVLEDRRENYGAALERLKAYLETPDAKKSGNQEVFALIDQIREKQEAAGQKVSDADIQQMAAKMNRAPATAAADTQETPVPEETHQEEAAPGATDVRSDDMESLEKALQ